MEERLIELELKFTEQQALLQELSDVLWAQQKTIDALKTELASVRERLDEAQPAGTVRTFDPASDKPPHY